MLRAKDMNYITRCSKQPLVLDLYSHYKAAVSLPFSCALLTALCDPSRHSLMGESLSVWCSFNRTHQLPLTAAHSNFPRLNRRRSIALRDSAALLTWSDDSSSFLHFTVEITVETSQLFSDQLQKIACYVTFNIKACVNIYQLTLGKNQVWCKSASGSVQILMIHNTLYRCFDVPLIQQKEINPYIKPDFIIWMIWLKVLVYWLWINLCKLASQPQGSGLFYLSVM